MRRDSDCTFAFVALRHCIRSQKFGSEYFRFFNATYCVSIAHQPLFLLSFPSPYPCICSHYFVHGGWFSEETYLLDNVDTIRHIPATIIQGRYDVVTPVKTAWDLHEVIHVLCPLYCSFYRAIISLPQAFNIA